MRISPDSTCTCRDYDYVRDLFPEFASDEQIAEVIGFGFTKRSETSSDGKKGETILPVGDSDVAKICSMTGSEVEAPEDFDWG